MTINFSSIKPYIYKWISVMGESVAITLTNLIIAFILTSKYGLEYYGQFALYQALFLSYSTILKPLTWQAIVKFYPESNLNLLSKHSLKIELTFLSISFFITAAFSFLGVFDLSAMYMVFLCIACSIINNGTTVGINRSLGNFFKISIVVCLSSIVKLFFVFFCSFNSLNIFVVLTGVDFAFWLLFLINTQLCVLSNPDVRIISVTYQEFGRFSIWGTFHEILDLPIKHIDKLIVSFYLGSVATAILDLAKRISQVVAQIAVPLNTILYPKYTYLVSTLSLKKIVNISVKISYYLAFVSFMIFFVFLISFEQLDIILTSGLLVGQKDLVLSFLFIQLIALVFCWVHPLSIAIGSMKTIAVSIFISNIIYIFIICLFSFELALFSVVLAFFAQVSLVVCTKLYVIMKFIRRSE